MAVTTRGNNITKSYIATVLLGRTPHTKKMFTALHRIKNRTKTRNNFPSFGEETMANFG